MCAGEHRSPLGLAMDSLSAQTELEDLFTYIDASGRERKIEHISSRSSTQQQVEEQSRLSL